MHHPHVREVMDLAETNRPNESRRESLLYRPLRGLDLKRVHN
ncbi:hypothetical protein DAD186_04490 [Dermabacter vaginalis]|uniref:Uncharacterized protein n=1 Tax=Dermabacter vaginalis TaxID=1630135 RepID=A0A1B0ZGD4_9MICO|nr:hypothetical protein DAD186_04490 [Dermabacter vaginalis]